MDEPTRPAALRPGDLVMLVSPAGPARVDRVARGIELLTGWGLRVVTAPHVYAQHGYLAGEDAVRLADLNLALRDPEVRGVVCTRGGYGVQRIVDGVDLDAVRADPLDGVAGVALGQFTECADEWSTSAVDVLTEHLVRLGVPVLGGLPIGHGHDQLTGPIGVPATVDVAAGTLTVDPAVR